MAARVGVSRAQGQVTEESDHASHRNHRGRDSGRNAVGIPVDRSVDRPVGKAGTALRLRRGGAHHAGDLPSIRADASGNARHEAWVKGLALRGPQGIVGRSIVVHRDPDDYRSQPAGNSGPRIACGVIAG